MKNDMKIKSIFFTILIVFSLFSVAAYADTQSADSFQKKFDVYPGSINAGSVTSYQIELTTWKWRLRKSLGGYLELKVPESFGLNSITDIQAQFSDTSWHYRVSSFEIDGNNLYLYFASDKHCDHCPGDGEDNNGHDWSDWWNKFRITVTLDIEGIKNPSEGGIYSFKINGYDEDGKKKLGPVYSNTFLIEHSIIDSIAVTPNFDTTIQAGDSIIFSATAYDEFGNEVDSVHFEYALIQCTSCIGTFTDSVLHVTRVGESRVQVSGGGQTITAGLVTVTPGELARMELQIDETQFVGVPLLGDPAIILYDAFNNLKTDFDLTETPIYLQTDEFSMYLDNQESQVGGVVRLNYYDIYFTQPVVSVQAIFGDVSTGIIDVYVNIYEILTVLNSENESLVQVQNGEATEAKVVVVNNGNLVTDSLLNLRAYYESDPANFVTMNYDMSMSMVGIQDSLNLILPATSNNGTDELIVIATSHFDYEGDVYQTVDTLTREVNVIGNVDIMFSSGSFLPDTAFAGTNISVSFDIDYTGSIVQIDTSYTTIEILAKDDTAALFTVYQGFVSPSEFTENQIRFEGVQGRIEQMDNYANDFYPVRLSYHILLGNNLISISEEVVDSMYIYFDNGISLIDGTLSPTVVYAGTNVSFEFKVNLDSYFPYKYVGQSSSFRIFDENYSTSTNLFLDTDSLQPGENMLRSASISIQEDQIGGELLAEAVLRFTIPGTIDTLEFRTSFTEASLPIRVFKAPTVQVIDLEIVAPNAPKVNTSQELKMVATITNTAEQPVLRLDVHLVTIDYASTIHNSTQTIAIIQPNDTVQVEFDVTAAETENLLPESFRIDILSTDVIEIPPVNNSAFLFIEDPAMLELSYRVNGVSNVNEIIVNHSDMINLSFGILNVGTSKTTSGQYELDITGLPSGSLHFDGVISVDSLLDFSLVAPSLDTVINFDFVVTDHPLDVNTNAPAIIDRDTVQFRVVVLSDETELTVETNIVNSNLVNPEVQKRFADLIFNNTGSTLLNDIKLNKIEFALFDINYSEIDVRSVLNIGESGFYDGSFKLTNATTGGNKVTFWFNEYVIAAQETKTISFLLQFKETEIKSVIVESFVNQIDALYDSGPNTGFPVLVQTISGSEEVISLQIVIKGTSLEDSFIISDNPFNPETRPALFSYQLDKEADIEFRIFTISGEEVFAKIISAGQEGAQAGENMLEWNGKNNSGHMVLNGVYIASILNKATGEYTRKKIALVK